MDLPSGPSVGTRPAVRTRAVGCAAVTLRAGSPPRTPGATPGGRPGRGRDRAGGVPRSRPILRAAGV